MKTRSALVAAIACGAAAVLLVGADRAFNVTATLEVRAPDGSWKTVSEIGSDSERPHPSFAFCGSHHRLTVRNSMPWGTSPHVTINVSGPNVARTLMDEPWSLGAGASRTHEFDVPPEAFAATGPGDGTVKGTASIEVILDGDYRKQMYASACEAAA